MTDKERIDKAVEHLIDGLLTDGEHHKQWDMQQALEALKGEKWVKEYRKLLEEDGYYDWDDGIPA